MGQSSASAHTPAPPTSSSARARLLAQVRNGRAGFPPARFQTALPLLPGLLLPTLLCPQWSPPPRVCSPCPPGGQSDPGLQAKSFGNSSSPLLSVKPGALRPCSVSPAWSLCAQTRPSCPDPPPSPIPRCLSPRLPFPSLHDVGAPSLLAALLAGGSSCKPKLPTSSPSFHRLALSPHHDSLHPCLRVPIVP